MENAIEEIKSRVKVRDVLEMYNIYPSRYGRQYCCVWHDDTNPSASVTKDGNKLHCYACNRSGDIFDIVATQENCDIKRAMRIVDNKFNLGIFRELTEDEKRELARKARERQLIKERHEWWENFKQEQIKKIAKELHIMEKAQDLSLKLKGQFDAKQREDMFYFSAERQMFLNWLYETLCEFSDKKESYYDYKYGSDIKDLLRKLKKGEIIV